MTKERFNELVDDIIGTASTTLKTKNAKYAPADDALHNFHYGAQLDNSTTAQTIWHYMKKHMVALLDKINRDDWTDLDDAKEKIQDIINYLIFMWCAANESQMNTDIEPCIDVTEDEDGNYSGCECHCAIERRSCDYCAFNYIGVDDTGRAIEEPCKSCKNNFVQGTEEYKTAPSNWEVIEDKNCYSCEYFNEDLDYELSICKACKNNYSKDSPLYESASLHWKRKE